MKICIFGAGAIGGYIGGLLAHDGVDVSLIARGPHLAAMQENGLTLHHGGEVLNCRPFCSDDPAKLGVQDYVILALKAHSLPGIVDSLQPLLGPETAVVNAQNGLPWWYFYKLGGDFDGTRLESVDPGGVLWEKIGPERAIGCVVWQSAELAAPGVIHHTYGDRMPLGEPDGSPSARAEALSRVLISAGIKSPVRPKLRNEIWMKLWGNLSFNPVSVLTGGTLEDLARMPESRAVIGAMMIEAQAIGEALGVRFAMSAEDRIGKSEAVGAHRSSMLQDLDAGRPMELDALLGVMIELGRLVGLPTPTCQTVYNLTLCRARQAGCIS